MESKTVRAQIFERHYIAAKENLENGDYEKAVVNLSKAAKAMYELAAESTGEEKKRHTAHADKIYDQIAIVKRKAEQQRDNKLAAPKPAQKTSAAANTATTASTAAAEKKPAAEESKKKDPALSAENKILNSSSSRGSEENDETAVFKAMDVPNISFDDVVGLYDVKETIRKKVIEPRQFPELFAKYKMKIGGGVLMYGPPGTGKTMIAKAIAHEVKAKFFAVRCSKLVSTYFGGTEKNINELFETARREKNAVIFFDEFDALAVNREKTRSSVMQRVVPELLTQMQGVQDDNGKDGHSLLILAATNNPWLMDTAFLRPGRFDERIYVGLPDFDARKGILAKSLAGVPQEDIDLDALAQRCEGYNCSDVNYLVERVKRLPFDRAKRSHQEERVTMEDFEEAFKKCRSSVAKSDIEKVMAWRKENGG